MQFHPVILESHNSPQAKLWIYTNYHCNLSCPYCLAKSTPTAAPRLIPIEDIYRIINEAQSLGFDHLFFTGGEPFLREDIYQILAHSAEHLPTTVLTNAMLLSGKRLKKLIEVQKTNLFLQVSLDGASAEQHDAYRGRGSWNKTMAGIKALLAAGFQVSISTTETPANCDKIQEICSLHQALGIPEDRHIIRTLAKRGFSNEGIEVNHHNLPPEITITHEGAFWHPMTTEEDMLLRKEIFPLAELIRLVQEKNLQFEDSPVFTANSFT